MRERGHRRIDHTADMAFEVWAESFGALLVEATEALGALVLAPTPDEPTEGRDVEVEGADREDVLVAWLGEVVWALDDDAWLARSARVDVADARRARGRLLGRRLAEGEAPDRVVKAVTYHDLHVRPGRDGRPWRATVVLDL